MSIDYEALKDAEDETGQRDLQELEPVPGSMPTGFTYMVGPDGCVYTHKVTSQDFDICDGR